MPRRAYLDHAASSPLLPRVAEAMEAAQVTAGGNPSSLHAEGRRARRVLEDAREALAHVLKCPARDVVFTGSATEANNAAMMGLARMAEAAGRRTILLSPIEHPSILEPAQWLARRGFTLRWMPVSPEGIIDLEGAAALLDDSVGFTALMWVNNEIGTIQPVGAWGEICRAADIRFHCDAVQALGKLPWDPPPAATLALSAHKIGGPRGVGALTIPAGVRLAPLILGGAQERGRRAGTENVVGAVGFAAAARALRAREAERLAHLRELEELLVRRLRCRVPDVAFNVPGDVPRVPGIWNLRWPGHYGETLLMRLDLEGVAVSLGSACSSGAVEPSHVLKALGRDRETLFSSFRVSAAERTTEDDIEHLVTALATISGGDGGA